MARKFITIPVQSDVTGKVQDYRINSDYIRLYWAHSTPGKVNLSIANPGGSNSGTQLVAEIDITVLDRWLSTL